MSPEQSISHQLKILIVRLLADVFDVRANDLHGGISNLSKSYGCRTLRYDPAPPTTYPSDRSEGFICDKGKARRFGEQLGWAEFRDERWGCGAQVAVGTKRFPDHVCYFDSFLFAPTLNPP